MPQPQQPHNLPIREGLNWNQIVAFEEDYFPDWAAASRVLIAEIERVQGEAVAGIESSKNQALQLLRALNLPGGAVHEAVVTAAFDAANVTVNSFVDGVKAAVAGMVLKLTVRYTATGGCPVGPNNSKVQLHNWDFDPTEPPSLSQGAEITLNIPPAAPVLSITVPSEFKWKHRFTLTPTQQETEVESLIDAVPNHHQPRGLDKDERVVTRYTYDLRYEAEVVLGPVSTTVDADWVAVQRAASTWCEET